MGQNGVGFINFIENYYSSTESVYCKIRQFKYLYAYIEDNGINPENLSYDEADRIREEIAVDDNENISRQFRISCGRLLWLYVDWLNCAKSTQRKKTAEVCVTESGPSLASFDRIKDIDIIGIVGDKLLDINYKTRIIRYEDTVSDNEKIPGLVTFIDQEYDVILKHLDRVIPNNAIYSLSDRIRIILSPLNITRRYYKPYTPKDLDELFEKYEGIGIGVVPIDEVRRTINGVSITNTVDGKYVCENDVPTIYIYYRVLDNNCDAAYLADVRRVLSHEIFHAVHHMISGGSFNVYSDESERVKEALADFFSFTYCISDCCKWTGVYSESVKCARKRYKAWKKALDSIWPYAYALYFMCVKGKWMPYATDLKEYEKAGCIDKYRKVYDASKHSIEKAYAILIEEPEKYVDILPYLLKKGKNSSPKSHAFNMITMPVSAMSKMDPEKLEEAFYEENVNSKESLAPIFIMEILQYGKGRKYGAVEIQQKLEEIYRIDIKLNAVRRHLNTLAVNYEDIVWRIQEGHNCFFMYSEKKPEGCITWEDVEYSPKLSE